ANELLHVMNLERNEHGIQARRRESRVVNARRQRMTYWIANDSENLCLAIDFIDSINLEQVCRSYLTRRCRCLFINRCIGQKRSARRAKNARHDAGLAHGNRNHLANFSVSAIEQTENVNAVDCIVSLNCDLDKARRRHRYSLVNLVEIVRDASKIMMRANHPTPIKLFTICNDFEYEIQLDVE